MPGVLHLKLDRSCASSCTWLSTFISSQHPVPAQHPSGQYLLQVSASQCSVPAPHHTVQCRGDSRNRGLVGIFVGQGYKLVRKSFVQFCGGRGGVWSIVPGASHKQVHRPSRRTSHGDTQHGGDIQDLLSSRVPALGTCPAAYCSVPAPRPSIQYLLRVPVFKESIFYVRGKAL